MNWTEALKSLSDGCNVKRPSWDTHQYVYVDDSTGLDGMPIQVLMLRIGRAPYWLTDDDRAATDWEVVG